MILNSERRDLGCVVESRFGWDLFVGQTPLDSGGAFHLFSPFKTGNKSFMDSLHVNQLLGFWF